MKTNDNSGWRDVIAGAAFGAPVIIAGRIPVRVVYNRLLPVRGFVAINLFGVIFARRKFCPLPESTIRHEAIHTAQARECGGWLPYYVKYLWYWFRRGYRDIPFEVEALINESNSGYLDRRKTARWSWRGEYVLAE
jgi:hypothetical protein